MQYKIEWDDIEYAAKKMFSVWVDQPELLWARSAWKILEEAGLSEYDNELERHSVFFRFLVLGGIYRDFCCIAWEECTEKDYDEWAEYLDLDSFIIGLAYAKINEYDPNDDLCQNDALKYLIEEKRSKVVCELIDSFDGVSGLYGTLWKSRQSYEETDYIDEEETEFILPGMIEGTDPFSPMTPARTNAYCWVDEGCYAL